MAAMGAQTGVADDHAPYPLTPPWGPRAVRPLEAIQPIVRVPLRGHTLRREVHSRSLASQA